MAVDLGLPDAMSRGYRYRDIPTVQVINVTHFNIVFLKNNLQETANDTNTAGNYSSPSYSISKLSQHHVQDVYVSPHSQYNFQQSCSLTVSRPAPNLKWLTHPDPGDPVAISG